LSLAPNARFLGRKNLPKAIGIAVVCEARLEKLAFQNSQVFQELYNATTVLRIAVCVVVQNYKSSSGTGVDKEI